MFVLIPRIGADAKAQTRYHRDVTDLPDKHAPAKLTVGPINRRISVMILAFVLMSLTASALPLLPGIDESLPLDLLNRRGAVTIYGVFLVSFFLFCFPLFVKRPSGGGGVRPWWWVGLFILGFAFVPLFVLAYIAGVSREVVLAILLWGGFSQGVVLVLLRLLKYRFRRALVAGMAVAVVFVPFVGFLRGLLADDIGLAIASQTPFPSIMGMTRDFAEPPLGLLVTMTIAAQALLASLHALSRRRVQAVAGGLVALILLGGAAMSSRPVSQLTVTHGPSWVEGRPFPVYVGSEPDTEILVDVASRETYHWEMGKNGRWVYPIMLSESDSITVTAGSDRRVVSPTRLGVAGRLIVELTADPASRLSKKWLSQPGVRRTHYPAIRPPGDVRGYLQASAVFVSHTIWRGLGPDVLGALDDYIARGGLLFLGDAPSERNEQVGEGRIIWRRDFAPPDGLSLSSRATRGLEQNLYSNFALPDWGRVDLSGLLIFLTVYHILFLSIFILPLAFDARKSMAVYLVSVGCVLLVFIGASHVAVGRIFLSRTQVLQQDISLFVSRPSSKTMIGRQITCFASFNGQSAPIQLPKEPSCELVYRGQDQAVGAVSLSDEPGGITLDNVELDRFQKKQVVRLTEVLPNCLRPVWQSEGELLLEPVAGASDKRGLLTARRLGGFVRRGGQLFPVQISGDRLIISSVAERRSWRGVVPVALQKENGISFIQHLLGRYVPDKGPLLAVFVQGLQPLHESADYLDRREVCSLLVIPLPPE